MPERQTELSLDSTYSTAPVVVPELRDEIARVWGLPIGSYVELTFRPSFSVSAATGVLELRAAPPYPWNPHDPLALRISGIDFSNRDLERWIEANPPPPHRRPT